MIPPLPGVAAVLLCSAIPALALLHGGARPGARLLGQCLALMAFVLAVVEPSGGIRWRVLRGPLTALLGLAALALAQSIALPLGIVAMLVPERLDLVRETAAASGLDVPSAIAVSLTPEISRQVAVELVCLAAALVAAATVFGGRVSRRWLVAAALTAALGQFIAGAGPLLSRQVPRLVGAYANPDHLALLLELGAAMCLAAIVWLAVGRRWSRNSEHRFLGIAALGAVLLVLLLGIGLTGSRAAIVATGVGLGVELALLSFRPGHRRPLLVALTLIVLVTGVLGWIGTERVFGRLLATSWHDATAEGRAAVWRESAALVSISPWIGTGMGAFQESYALVQKTVNTRVTWGRAHNDYLELLIAAGWPGLVVLAVGCVWTVRDLLRRFWRAGPSENRLFVLGVLGALAAAAGHEFLDFGLALPANALLLVVLVGSAAAVEADAREARYQIESEGRTPAPASRRSSSTTRFEVEGRSRRSTEPASIP